MGAKIVTDTPFILVSELYKSGAPRAVSLRRETPIEDAYLRVVVTPGAESVVVVAEIEDQFGFKTIHERTTETVLVDWQFNSRRARVRCSLCKNFCDKLLISTGPLAGSLLCGRCANLRYPSQDQDPVERLQARLRKIVERLGGEVGAEAIPAFPKRPKGMHSTTYEDRARQFREVAEQLESVLGDRADSPEYLRARLELLLRPRPESDLFQPRRRRRSGGHSSR